MSQQASPDNNDQPAWHLLPDDPVGFFGLSEAFDRKDLKRAYNTLLRRFKPDKCPQEFQKLRAAFEHLDGQLRYGETPSIPASQLDTYRWSPPASDAPAPRLRSRNEPDAGPDGPEPVTPSDADQPASDEQSPSDERQPLEEGPPNPPQPASHKESETARPIGPKSLRDRIGSESPQDLYEELKLNPREAYDYYALAVLSDAVAEPDQQLFLHWLLAGIKAFPAHPALMQLLTAYFEHGDIADNQLASILVRVSQAVRTDRFYFLAEKLFDRLTLVRGWDEVQATLKQCAANINDHTIRSRVVFTCHLLRRALWLAPLEQCQEMLAYINHHYEYLEGRLEYELELNSLLLHYVQARERFIVKGPIAQMIDQALRKFCLDIEGRGDHEIVKTQAYIAHHPQQLFREFGLTPAEDMQLLVPWIWLSDEVEDRLETQEYPPKPAQLMTATLHMMQQIDRNFPLTPIQFYNLLDRFVPIAICVVLILLMPLLARVLSDILCPGWAIHVALSTFALGCALSAIYWFRLKRDTTGAWLINYLRRMIEKQYLGWWRSLIARFLAATHFPYRDVDRAIDAVLETHRKELNMCNWLPHFYGRDPALYVYATAVRFLR